MAVSRSRGCRTSFQRPVGSRVWLFQGYRRLAGLGVQGQGAPYQSPTFLGPSLGLFKRDAEQVFAVVGAKYGSDFAMSRICKISTSIWRGQTREVWV